MPTAPATPASEPSITLSVDAGIAIAILRCPSIRERQALMVHDELRAVAGRGEIGGRVGVGMAEVTDLSSACLNALIAVAKHCSSLGGRLVVFGLSSEVRRLFELTRIDRLLHVARDERDARRVLSDPDAQPGLSRSFFRALSTARA